MADQNNSQNNQDPNTLTGGGNGNQTQVTFTPEQQAVIDRIIGERSQRAANSATANLLKDLGVENADALKNTLEEAKRLKQSQLSEAEQAKALAADLQKKLDAESSKAQAAQARATETLMRTSVFAEASKQGFDESEFASVWTAIKGDKQLLEAIKAKTDSDDFEGVETVVKQVATAHPRWLKTAPPPAPNTNAQNRNNGKPVSQDDLVARKRSQYAGTI